MAIIDIFKSLFLPQATPPVPEKPAPKKDDPLGAFIALMPKAEIHVHFEGAIHAESILRLARKHGERSIRTRADAEWALYFRDPHEFFRQFLFLSGLLKDIEDFYTAARDWGARLHEQNIRYVEFTFAPHKFMMQGLAYADLIDAIDRGLQDASGGEEREHRFIIDIVRDLGPEAGMRVVKAMEENPHPRVVGIGLGGGENYPPEASKEVFERAGRIGLRKTAHAGEGRGPESIWGALNHLQVERIDHGVRAIEDPALVDHLAERGIPLNICPTSNVMLRVFDDISAHPVRALHDRGIPVNISTDDPAFFRTTLSDEFHSLIDAHSFTASELALLTQNALAASFLDDTDRARLSEAIRLETLALADSLSMSLDA